MFRSAIQLIESAVQKPPRVLAIRAVQEARLAAARRFNGWRRLERRIEYWWTARRVDEYVNKKHAGGALIARDGPVALRVAAERGCVDASALIAMATRMRNRDFELLGAPVPREGPWPWHTDWRSHHRWTPAYFRSYRYYETHRPRPYDVKVPWELC